MFLNNVNSLKIMILSVAKGPPFSPTHKDVYIMLSWFLKDNNEKWESLHLWKTISITYPTLTCLCWLPVEIPFELKFNISTEKKSGCTLIVRDACVVTRTGNAILLQIMTPRYRNYKHLWKPGRFQPSRCLYFPSFKLASYSFHNDNECHAGLYNPTSIYSLVL